MDVNASLAIYPAIIHYKTATALHFLFAVLLSGKALHMKKLSTIFLLLGAMVLLTGCPLQIKAPIDNGSYKSTDWLVGTWKGHKADGAADKTYL